MALNENEFNIITARIMFRTDWKPALSWLKAKGLEISKNDYYRTLAALDENARTRLNELAIKFEVILADEVDKFKALEKMMWEEYHKEKTPMNRSRILMMIANLQPYITSLYDQTRTMIESKVKDAAKEDSVLSKFTEFQKLTN